MKLEHKVIAFSVFLGLLVGLNDAVLDYLIFYEGTFLELLITKVPPHEIYIRTVVLACFLIFGIVTSRVIVGQGQAEEELRIERDNLNNIFEAVEDGIYIVNQQYDIQYVNPVLVKDFGPWEGHKCYAYFHNREDICPWCKNEDVMAGKTVQWEWYSSRNGRTYDLIGTPLKNPDGSISKLEIFRDITDRVLDQEIIQKHQEHLEELVEERTAELEMKTKNLEESQKAVTYLLEEVNDSYQTLEETNKQLLNANLELEAFSYSVSHDLRAPLRAIDGFTNILMENYVSKLDDEGKRLGSVIQQSTKKMGQLIDDLLAFSRLGRASMSFSEIKMKKLTNDVYLEETNSKARKRITFTIADLPNVEGDPAMMRQLWTNLISNALKFSAHVKQAVISVSCQEEEDKIIYCIKDNGAGFNMKYKDKLFNVFQRLHSENEFEGTGVGLALVQQIVHRHAGEAWAEGEVDHGAAFYFSLPNERRI